MVQSAHEIHACVMNNWHMPFLRLLWKFFTYQNLGFIAYAHKLCGTVHNRIRLKICSIQHTRKKWVLFLWEHANGIDPSCDFKKLKNSVVENIRTDSHIQESILNHRYMIFRTRGVRVKNTGSSRNLIDYAEKVFWFGQERCCVNNEVSKNC